MREIIAVCRSQKKSIGKVASILDRYFWRIGDRTWRGRASNACLDRVSAELRKVATRNTAVVLHEIRSSSESRRPIIRIGSKSAFSDEGVVPVASHPSDYRHASTRGADMLTAGAVVGIAALFHDIGKATVMFQKKLRAALKKPAAIADAVRHEVVSAVIWDRLFGDLDDAALKVKLTSVTAEDIDAVWKNAAYDILKLTGEGLEQFPLLFLSRSGTLASSIGLLILTHHRLPDGTSNHLDSLTSRHVASIRDNELKLDHLMVAKGTPFWHEWWFLARLKMEASRLTPDGCIGSVDIALRASLMFADHFGSAEKKAVPDIAPHLANTKNGEPADSLFEHVRKVYIACRGSFGMLHTYRDRYPALAESEMPVELLHPRTKEPRFVWQAHAASAARKLCAEHEGGFFGCIMSGTGSGKTRGAPAILAAAAFADSKESRRYFRMTLGVGLRTLATQTGREYVDDLGFSAANVSVLVGKPPIDFQDEGSSEEASGSESLLSIPEWLRVRHAEGDIPLPGSEMESDWIRGLSLDTDRGLPSFLERVIEHAGKKSKAFRDLVKSPILAATIDHVMAVASPTSSSYLPQTVRIMTSDLILDEIDQYDPEDIAAVGRLVYQAGAAGRRVVIMSATLPKDVAVSFCTSYERGWKEYANSTGMDVRVNILCTADAPGACFTNADGSDIAVVYDECRYVVDESLSKADALRRGRIMAPVSTWLELVHQIDEACSALHDDNASRIEGFSVSVGFIRMTRISHTAALAVQLPSGILKDRLRLKVCLHSNFPRLHRAWLERRLKQALTRKIDPDSGVRDLCFEQGLFEKARLAGVKNIEIVVICSPVIETGNDLDFDWAILDPISVRSIVQSAGRVWRHRKYDGRKSVNVLVLGRSPIAMQSGKLARPGVETPVPAATEVSKPRSLDIYTDRLAGDLIGHENILTIDARLSLDETVNSPQREAEDEFRGKMNSIGDGKPLGTYTSNVAARLNRRITESRRFRRQTSKDVLYAPVWKIPEGLKWHLDLNPGTRESAMRPATVEITDLDEEASVGVLFADLESAAMEAAGLLDIEDGHLLDGLEISFAIYDQEEIVPRVTYSHFSGMTRGSWEDLFPAFGKGQ